jgi:1,4-dihydroxy-2-naphthoate octaprenyltransferase
MIKALWMMMKPQSFMISVVSVSVGTSLAALRGAVDWPAYLLTMLGIVFLHGGANVVNDYFDYRYHVDTDEVPGSYGNELRVLIRGLMKPRQVLAIGIVIYALAIPIGVYLISLRGMTILLLGVIGFITGVCYTARPVALKYKALGEIAVFFMFGPLMVSGAYFVQMAAFSSQVVWVSVPFGIFVALVLFANNIRDIGFDGRVGIQTVATLLGGTRSARVYQFCVLLTYVLIGGMVVTGLLSAYALLTLFSLPLAFKLMGMFRRGVPADADAQTARLDVLFGVLLIVGIQLQRFFR